MYKKILLGLSIIFTPFIYAENSNYLQDTSQYTDKITVNNNDGLKEYSCDDLKGDKRIIREKDCMSSLVKYNAERKAEKKPTCSVRRLHKNKDGCYCFPRVAKGEELTHMCQEKDFYKNDHGVNLSSSY